MTREEAIEWFLNSPFYHKEHVPFEMAIEALKVEPVRHGHWCNTWDTFVKCSECGSFTGGKYNYCPFCGAKMNEVTK